MAVQVLDGLDLMDQIGGLLDAPPVQPLAQQLGLLRAVEVIAVDDPPHPLGGQAVSIVFHFHDDEAAITAIALVGFEHSMSRRAGARKGI